MCRLATGPEEGAAELEVAPSAAPQTHNETASIADADAKRFMNLFSVFRGSS
jgi:hypothetical protein